MEWKGFLKDGRGNNGTIKLTGELIADQTGRITNGHISLPLSTLVNINLPTIELKNELIHHLQSPDFFDMAAHPELGFKVNALTPDPVLSGTYEASGELTVLGKSNLISFPVKVNPQGNKLEVTGEARIDRTLWGMTYASDENATDGLYVRPDIDVQFRLVAVKKDKESMNGSR